MADTVTAETSRKPSKWSMVGKNPRTMPLEDFDLSHPGIWEANEHLPFLARLREEAPVHYCRHSTRLPSSRWIRPGTMRSARSCNR